MKFLLLSVLTLCLCACVYPQTINELDKKNGYKAIHLGQSISEIQGLYPNNEFPGFYKCTSAECQSFLGYIVNSVDVQIDKEGKVKGILVWLQNPMHGDGIEDFVSKINGTYGRYTNIKTNSVTMEERYQWAGKKVVLDVICTLHEEPSKGWIICLDFWRAHDTATKDY